MRTVEQLTEFKEAFSKYDETMMDYYVAFIAMCKRASGLELTEEEGRRYLLNVTGGGNKCTFWHVH